VSAKPAAALWKSIAIVFATIARVAFHNINVGKVEWLWLTYLSKSQENIHLRSRPSKIGGPS
jgi:hypothetical protein